MSWSRRRRRIKNTEEEGRIEQIRVTVVDDATTGLFMTDFQGIFCSVSARYTTSEYMVVSRRGMKCNASKACATSPPPSLMLTLHLRRFHVGSIGTNYDLKAYKDAVSATLHCLCKI